MTDFAKTVTRTPEEIAAHVERSKRLRTAIINAQERLGYRKLEAVLGSDGILIAEFYGIRPGGKQSRVGQIWAQFDYDEMDEAIEFVDNMSWTGGGISRLR